MKHPVWFIGLLLVLPGAFGQSNDSTGIYSCVDAQGRRLTADRPLAECMDRDQRELNPSGTVKRVLKPVPTVTEQLQAERALEQKAIQEARVADERRRERALLARSPNQAAHDKLRAEALEKVDKVIAAAQERVQVLVYERNALDQEVQASKSAAAVPKVLQRRVEEAEVNLAAQRQFLLDHLAEKERIQSRFDDELATLKRLWAQP